MRTIVYLALIGATQATVQASPSTAQKACEKANATEKECLYDTCHPAYPAKVLDTTTYPACKTLWESQFECTNPNAHKTECPLDTCISAQTSSATTLDTTTYPACKNLWATKYSDLGCLSSSAKKKDCLYESCFPFNHINLDSKKYKGCIQWKAQNEDCYPVAKATCTHLTSYKLTTGGVTKDDAQKNLAALNAALEKEVPAITATEAALKKAQCSQKDNKNNSDCTTLAATLKTQETSTKASTAAATLVKNQKKYIQLTFDQPLPKKEVTAIVVGTLTPVLIAAGIISFYCYNKVQKKKRQAIALLEKQAAEEAAKKDNKFAQITTALLDNEA